MFWLIAIFLLLILVPGIADTTICTGMKGKAQDQALNCVVPLRQVCEDTAGVANGSTYVPVGRLGIPVGAATRDVASNVVVTSEYTNPVLLSLDDSRSGRGARQTYVVG